MIILGIDSSASPVSCAVYDNGIIKGEFYINTKITHSQTLMPMIKAVLETANLSPKDVDCFAVSAGPGSFTGVRIGISAIKGLAVAQNKPCVSVSTLKSMAYNLIDTDCIVIAGMDARCNQVYNAIFEIKDGVITRLCEDRAIMLNELKDEISNNLDCFIGKKVFAVGDGADLVYNILINLLPSIKIPGINKYQNASSVIFASLEEIKNEKFVFASELSPIYLRLPQAERELKKNQEKGE